MLEEAKRRLLRSTEVYDRQGMKKFLKNEKLVEAVNSIDIRKLQLLCKSTLHNKVKVDLLQNEESANLFQSIDVEKIELILAIEGMFIAYVVQKFLENTDAVNQLHCIGAKKLKLLNNQGKFQNYEYIFKLVSKIKNVDVSSECGGNSRMSLMLQKHLRELYNITSFDIRRFRRTHYSNIGKDRIIANIFKNQTVVDNINAISIRKFRALFKSERIGSIIALLIKNNNLADTINSVNNQKLSTLFASNKLGNEYIIMKVVLDSKGLDALNYVDTEKFALLVNSNKISGVMLKEILMVPILARRLTTIDLEKLKLLFDKLPGNYVFKIIRNQSLINAISSITKDRLSPLIDGERFNRPFIMGLLKNKRAVKLITSIDNHMFDSLLNDGTLYKHLVTTLFGKNNAERLDKLEVLFNRGNYCQDAINILMVNWNTFNGIDLIEMEKFKLLLFGNKLTCHAIEAILKNRSIVLKINQIDIDKLILICCPHSGLMIFHILSSEEILNGINEIDIRKLQFLLKYESGFLHDGLKKLLVTPKVVEYLNSMSFKHFFSLLESHNLLDPLFLEMLRVNGLNFVENIHVLFSNVPQNIVTKMKGMVNNNFLEFIFSIKTEKLKLLIGSHVLNSKFPLYSYCNRFYLSWVHIRGRFYCISQLLESQGVHRNSNIINSIDDEKLKLLLKFDHLKYVLQHEFVVESINRIPIEKFDIMCNWSEVITLLNKGDIIDIIMSFDIERFRLLAMSRISNVKCTTLIKIFRNNVACNLIHSLDIGRLRVLAEGLNGIRLLTLIPEYQNTLDFIKFTDIENLRQALAMVEFGELVKICKFYEGDTRRNFKFVILLLKNGHIKKIDYAFVRNNKAIYDKVREVFPHSFPIDQAIIKSNIDTQGTISSLKDRCIQAWLDLATTRKLKKQEDNILVVTESGENSVAFLANVDRVFNQIRMNNNYLLYSRLDLPTHLPFSYWL